MKKRILALDFGEKRIGVAISDRLGFIARAYKTVLFDESQRAIRKIKQICQKESISKIVIGLPLNLKGESGFQAKKTKEFAKALQKEVHLVIAFQDERFSSKEAERILKEQNIKGKKEKIDALSAVFILNQYLEKEDV